MNLSVVENIKIVTGMAKWKMKRVRKGYDVINKDI